MGVCFIPETKTIFWTSYYPFDKSSFNLRNFLEKKGVGTMLEDIFSDAIEKRFGKIEKVLHLDAAPKRESQVNRRHEREMIFKGKGSYSFMEYKAAMKRVLKGDKRRKKKKFKPKLMIKKPL